MMGGRMKQMKQKRKIATDKYLHYIDHTYVYMYMYIARLIFASNSSMSFIEISFH